MRCRPKGILIEWLVGASAQIGECLPSHQQSFGGYSVREGWPKEKEWGFSTTETRRRSNTRFQEGSAAKASKGSTYRLTATGTMQEMLANSGSIYQDR